MPRDPRPYLTFPIGYTIHPRVDMLSDPAFRAFHEMNDYCRINGTDGRVKKVLAAKRWAPKVMRELVSGDGDRPLVIDEGDDYFLRSYAEHQWTSEDAEALRQKRVEAGRAGGKKKAENRHAASGAGSKPLASASAQGWQNLAESKSESESRADLDTQLLPPSSLDPAARDFSQDEIEGFRKALSGFGGDRLDDLGLLALVSLLVEASPRPVGNYVGYVVRCTQRSPAKVRGLAEVAVREAGAVPSVAEIAADMDRAVAS